MPFSMFVQVAVCIDNSQLVVGINYFNIQANR